MNRYNVFCFLFFYFFSFNIYSQGGQGGQVKTYASLSESEFVTLIHESSVRDNKKFDDLESKNEDLILKHKELEVELKSFGSKVQNMSDNIWNIFSALLAIVLSSVAAASIFVFRENSIKKKEIEIQEKELLDKKKQIDTLIAESIFMMNRKVESEISVFKLKLSVHEVIQTNDISKGIESIYALVRLLERAPSLSHLPLLNKLLEFRTDLGDELSDKIDQLILSIRSN
ncbi:hypothetical protein ACMXYX_14090 [Neptuniibacter sp. QD72_48]|uniref:hypothetical protein n=1 Tax=Neptuniibacter sp. QD72_48 TaxID=3398214 RepID=UPI0039F530C6